jgi:hypothetical protein
MSIFLTKIDWLASPYNYDFGDYLFTGMVSLFWIVVIPVLLIGYLGDKIVSILKSR